MTYPAPYMPQNEITMLDAVLALKRPRRVLEYGAGGSTARWSKLPFVEEWLTVEHDEEWLHRVRHDAPEATLMGAPNQKVADYVEACTLGASTVFDLIFVDGRHRVACIQAAPQWLAPHGVVILHDASRTKYRYAWPTFPHRCMLTRGDGQANGLLLMWGDV